MIAGNHDSSDRFEAWGALTELVNVRPSADQSRPQREGLYHHNAVWRDSRRRGGAFRRRSVDWSRHYN